MSPGSSRKFAPSKHPRIFVSCVILACTALLVPPLLYVRQNHAWEPLPQTVPVAATREYALVRVGVIGDSWVAGDKLDKGIRAALAEVDVPCELFSVGHGGATSRRIYLDLQKSGLLDKELTHLVVVAGVNDTALHMGASWYAHHVLCIIRAAQVHGIRPVVVEVPDYGIRDLRSKLPARIKAGLYRILFDRTDDAIAAYRQALRDLVAATDACEVSLVPFPLDYEQQRELYANPAHLNAEGSYRLGRIIGTHIADGCRLHRHGQPQLGQPEK